MQVEEVEVDSVEVITGVVIVELSRKSYLSRSFPRTEKLKSRQKIKQMGTPRWI